MNNKNLVRNIKILIIFFCICFFGIIFYLTYFNLYVSQKIINDNSNPRIKAEENKRLRGLILDRDGNVLVYSKRIQNGKQKRYYKYGEVYAHITGYSSVIYGKSGIELSYNDVLSGKTLIYNNPISVFKRFLDVVMNKERKGNNIFLTIDDKLQQKTYSLLGDNIGAAVAINPKTGEILSMVSKPSFDPEKIDDKFDEYNSDSTGVPFLNRAAKGYYPPGSTFKIITASAALNYIDNIENNSFNCNGKLKIGDYILNDYNKESHGKINLKNAFKVSCNYTFGSIGMKLGYDKLKDMAENFMFNKEIPLNDEYDSINIKVGKIKIENDKSLALTAQDAIGQHGVTSNPMHMALIAASIANEGTMMKPYIVKQIRDDYNNILYEANPNVLKNCIDKKIADKVRDYMIEVVKSGTGKNAKINGITVAGKTGTAQVEGKNETHSWFVAFAPAQDPKIAVAVIVENGGVGGGTAASIVREMIKTYLKK
ncbi:peptidoglycan glycosyltransferase [Caloramator quimbayensis]|uniref:Peptidoglycan glycosyltransferase n=1 Tax=Caloramator quimbayensis TaxID=1147123 RepID=A0A1T4Y9W4_9CLOT|nr:penicillin-binding transpeptidase domain-containing protein [Caloramator quimbayensis]SKA98480.1 peptidoglycan glycosyltransferase [Caloramator quimbayensis]